MRSRSFARSAPPSGRLASGRRPACPIALAIVFAMGASTAQALPANDGTCRVTTYYADASLTTQVGSFSTCPGSRGLTGHRTPFHEVDSIPIGNVPHKTHPQEGFPCELQQDCQPDLQTPTAIASPKPPASGASGTTSRHK